MLKYNFINDDIVIDFELSHTMKDLVDKAEKMVLIKYKKQSNSFQKLASFISIFL